MPICIAITFDGYIEDIVLAGDMKSAQVYWQGKGIYAHHIRELSEEDLKNHPTGVLPILTTKKVLVSGFGKSDKKIVAVNN